MVLCLFLPCPAGFGEFPLAQVDCFSGCPLHDLDLFVHTLQLYFGSSVQCSNVGPFLYFHQLLDEGSMVILKIFISLTIGQGQFRPPLLYCLASYLGSSLRIPGNFSRIRFLASSIMAPSIKYLFPCSHLCPSSISTIPFPQVLLAPPLSPGL